MKHRKNIAVPGLLTFASAIRIYHRSVCRGIQWPGDDHSLYAVNSEYGMALSADLNHPKRDFHVFVDEGLGIESSGTTRYSTAGIETLADLGSSNPFFRNAATRVLDQASRSHTEVAHYPVDLIHAYRVPPQLPWTDVCLPLILDIDIRLERVAEGYHGRILANWASAVSIAERTIQEETRNTAAHKPLLFI